MPIPEKFSYICIGNSPTQLKQINIMFKIRIYQGCLPEGEYVEFEVSFDLFPKLVYQTVYQDHCVSVIDITDNSSYVIKTPEL